MIWKENWRIDMKICRKENIEKLNVMAYQLLYAQQLNDNQQIESIHIDNQNNQICVEGLIRGFESDINCLLNFDSEGNLVSWTCDDKDQAKIYNIAIIQWLLNHKIDQLPFHYQSVECSLREKTIKEKQQKRWEKKKDELLKRGQSFLNSKKTKL